MNLHPVELDPALQDVLGAGWLGLSLIRQVKKDNAVDEEDEGWLFQVVVQVQLPGQVFRLDNQWE